MKLPLLLFIALACSTLAEEPWPGVKFTEVRAYAWPTGTETDSVILPKMQLKPGVINKDGARLTPTQVKRLLAARRPRDPNQALFPCYWPHNAFVFYNASKPVAYIEVCFACYGSRSKPSEAGKAGDDWSDFAALATLFDELKLPMGEYANLEAFNKRFQKK